MKLKSTLLVLVVISSVLLAACGVNSAVETYVNKDIQKLKVEENLEEAGTKLSEILDECAQKLQNDETIDWNSVQQRIDPVIGSMKEMREKIRQIDTKDEKVKEINSYLVSTYDKLISGYEKMVEGLRTLDESLLEEAEAELNGSEADIAKWEELIMDNLLKK